MKKSRLAQRKLGTKPKSKPKKKSFFKIILIPVFLVVFIIVLFYIFSPKVWDGKSKFVVSVQSSSHDVQVLILDPANSLITTLFIPSQTEVQAANQLGTWKIGSITKLGHDKKLGEDFLKNSIIKSFSFPIDFNVDESFLDLVSGNLPKEFKAIFVGGFSEVSAIDKIRIALFSLQISNASRFNVDLSKTNELERVRLDDGSLGFKVAGNIPTNIESYFVAYDNAHMLNLLINNATSMNQYASITSKVVEILGANVASIQYQSPSDFDCKVTGLSKDIVLKIARVFSCEVNLVKPVNNFDIQIDIGKKFKDRF